MLTKIHACMQVCAKHYTKLTYNEVMDVSLEMASFRGNEGNVNKYYNLKTKVVFIIRQKR